MDEARNPGSQPAKVAPLEGLTPAQLRFVEYAKHGAHAARLRQEVKERDHVAHR
jgi:hypothetical protein